MAGDGLSFECFMQAVLDIAALKRHDRGGSPVAEARRADSERFYWQCNTAERRLGDMICLAVDGVLPEGGETAR